MNIKERNERANKIRLELFSLTDEQLLNFSASIHAGENVAGVHFESVIEYVKRISDDFDENIVF
jgi:hypothetical protein